MPEFGGVGPHLQHLWTLIRFGMVGALNTAVGLAVILGLEFGLHVELHLAALGGYAVGIVIGFVLNRGFVFRSDGHIGHTGVKYLIGVAIALAANQTVLTAALHLFRGGAWGHVAAQVTGMVTYTLLLFAICRAWVFQQIPSSSGEGS
jgi:putative flippase GtrA